MPPFFSLRICTCSHQKQCLKIVLLPVIAVRSPFPLPQEALFIPDIPAPTSKMGDPPTTSTGVGKSQPLAEQIGLPDGSHGPPPMALAHRIQTCASNSGRYSRATAAVDVLCPTYYKISKYVQKCWEIRMNSFEQKRKWNCVSSMWNWTLQKFSDFFLENFILNLK